MLSLAFQSAFHPIRPRLCFARIAPSPFLLVLISLRGMVSFSCVTLGDFYHLLALMIRLLPQTCLNHLPLPFGILLSFLFPTIPLPLLELSVGIPVL